MARGWHACITLGLPYDNRALYTGGIAGRAPERRRARLRRPHAYIQRADSRAWGPAVEILELVLATFGSLFALGSLAGSLFLIRRASRFNERVRAEITAAAPPFHPPATLVVPSRGDPNALEPNLRALLRQDYPALETILVVDSRADPLFALCERLCAELAPGRARAVATEDFPVTARASGKCAAQVRGLREVSPISQVLAFADDDITPPPEWLSRLVTPLGDDKVAVTTAYRWYVSSGGGLASHIRSAWSQTGLHIMFDPKWNFAWGGGMAMRREDFDKWQVAKGWEKAISDDYVVTISAKKDGRAITFVPLALAPSRESVTFSQLLEWCRRQTFMTRIYDPHLWKFALAPYLLFNGTMVLGFAVLLAAAVGVAIPFWALLAAAAFAMHFPLNLVKNAVYYRGISVMLPQRASELRSLFGAYLIGGSLSPFVMIWALLTTRDLRHIEWRGRKYEVNGPLDVRPL